MASDREIIRQHASWLPLIEVSGPFLSMPVLLEAFPHGLDHTEGDAEMRRRLRLAYEEWLDNQGGNRPEVAIHTQWLRFVLSEILALRPDTMHEGQAIPADLCYRVKDHSETLRPQLLLRSPFEQKARLLIQQYPPGQKLDKVLPDKHWKATPATRMMELLRASDVRLGLITNGEQWMLIDAPPNETTGYYSWYAALWLEEPLTLLAFRSLLGMERFFNVPQDERLEELLTKSAIKQQEVTEQLGDQVRRAVETLVRTLDRLDKDSQRALLHNVDEKMLYEAALTLMMRLVFLLSAEERELLFVDNPLYDENYAVSTMHKQLRDQADQQGEEVLGLRYDAWSRLLALFRLVYGGVRYHDLHMPAYGGHLFDPDRFPFLEGRKLGTSWREQAAHPLLIDNRTVLHLLSALQYLQVKVPGGGVEPRRLSFRGLDVEQIGHVYEGLLDHTAQRATSTILGLLGTSDSEPEAELAQVEQWRHKGEAELLSHLQELTRRSASSLQKQLAQTLERAEERSRLMEACDNQQDLFERVTPFAGLLRRDSFGNFVLVTPGSIYVTKGSDRRSTGTHYTPRSLTEPIVKHALDPLVYLGPAEGWPEEEWQLKSAAALLDLKICDMAMGSGAFLVQTCRYLAEKLVLAWELVEQQYGKTPHKPLVLPEALPSHDPGRDEPLPIDREERLAVARRLVSERCLYGVDKNPMAVEMAKLSLWLITLAKNRPFTFLDHALRSGDSILGADTRQLHNGSLNAKAGEITTISQVRYAMDYVLPTIIQKRTQIVLLSDNNIVDIETKERLLRESEQALQIIKLGADLLIAIGLSDAKRRKNLEDLLGMEYVVLAKAYDEALHQQQTPTGWLAKNEAYAQMRTQIHELLKGRNPFHWPLEFPEVFFRANEGFDAIVSNPPFQGGSKITGTLGTDYREYLVKHIAMGKRGNSDLSAYFLLQATKLVNQKGMVALLATNTIAQGDTREIALDQIINAGWIISRAITSRKWPGEASLEVAFLWLRNGQWLNPRYLDDKQVSFINSYLIEPGAIPSNTHRLIANIPHSFTGSKLDAIGFVLTPKEAQELIQKDSRNREVLFPYLNGEDLNSRPDQSPSRWVINFHDWPLERAETYPDCMKIVREKVKPEREKHNDKIGQEKWWLFLRTRPALYATIANMKRVLVIAQTSRTCAFTFYSTDIVFSHMLVVIAFEDDFRFSVLQSSIHLQWLIQYAATLKGDQRYIPSDCFETFAFPLNAEVLNNIGERYHNHRQSIMLARQEGLTKTYNRFHNPLELDADIVRLRELHREMDEAVARAYGWDDLGLEHDFHETKQGLRYTISEEARREVLDRLLLLNHQRHEEEAQAGLLQAKGGKGGKSKSNGANGQEKLQNGPIHAMLDMTGSTERVPDDVRQETLFE